MNTKHYMFSFVLALFAITIVAVGCDSTALESDPDGRGTIRFLLTDAPSDDMLEANVIIERIEIIDTTGTTVLVSDDTSEFNLLELQHGVTAELAETTLPAGVYNQIRILVNEEAKVIWSDSTTSTLKVPGGSQSGILIVGFDFIEINDGDDFAEITLDFDVDESFVVAGASGQVIFRPVIVVQNVDFDEGVERKSEKSAKSKKSAKSDKSQKSDKSEKSTKSDKSQKSNGSDGDSSASGDSNSG